MNWFSALVLLAVYWFMTLFIVLPLRMTTQAEAGEVVKGTHGSAPDNPQLKKKFILTSIISGTLWVITVAIIISGVITMEDIDLYTLFGGELD